MARGDECTQLARPARVEQLEVGDCRCERIRPRRVILTHMGFDIDWGWLQKKMPKGIEAGYDGLVLEMADLD